MSSTCTGTGRSSPARIRYCTAGDPHRINDLSAAAWQQIVWQLRAPLGGAYNVILRNPAPTEFLVTDDLKIEPVYQ